MGRYYGVDLDFGEYNRPRDRVEFDMMTSGMRNREVTIRGVTFDPVAHVAKGLRPQRAKRRAKQKPGKK